MLSSFLFSLAFADCPDPEPLIRNAEEDAVAYFLADAEAELALAADSFACMAPTPTLVARFFLAQAMIWSLQEDARSTEALHRAKQLAPDYFTESLGAEMRERWQALEVESLAPTISIEVRGRKKTDVLVIDGSEVTGDPPATTPGLHLVQLQRKDAVVYGRIVEARSGEPLALNLAAAGPKPAAATTGFQPHVAVPIALRGLKSADGTRVSMVRDVVTLASLSPEGRQFAQERRRNTVYQGIALGSLAAGSFMAYHGVWDLAVGHHRAEVEDNFLVVNGVAMAVGGLTWELILKARRRQLKKRLVDQANQVAP